MTLKIVRRLDMLKRIVAFLAKFHLPLPRDADALNAIAAIIATLEAAAQNQVGGSGNAAGGVDLRETISRELRAYLKDVNRTARTLDSDHPGMRPVFRLPKSGSYPALLATARNIIAVATSMEASFLAAGMPETFLSELNDLLAAFENATQRKHVGGIARSLGTAGLKLQADLGVIAATKLDACVRNYFRRQPEILAAWTSARHIQRDPVRSREAADQVSEQTPITSASITTDGQANTNALLTHTNPAFAAPAGEMSFPSSKQL